MKENSLNEVASQVRDKLKELFNLTEREINEAIPFVFNKLQVYFKRVPDTKRVEKLCAPIVTSMLHVLIHEISHAIVEDTIQGLNLNPEDKCFLYEVIARFIERRLSLELKEELQLKTVIVESFEEQVNELLRYSELRNLKIGVKEYEKMYKYFWREVERGKGMEELAKMILAWRWDKKNPYA